MKPHLSVPNDPGQIAAWRNKARRTLRQLLNVPGTDLMGTSMKRLGSWRHGSLTAHRVLVAQRDSEPFDAIILEPPDLREPRSAWLCLHGSVPGGMASVTGLIEKQKGGRKSLTVFEDDYALQLTRRGYVTMSFHLPGFGSRSDGEPPADALPDAMHFETIMLGRTYLGWCTTDAIAALSVLADWPTVRRMRIGAVGFSSGGTLAAILAAIDARVRAAAVSGRCPSWRQRIAAPGHSYVPRVPSLITQLDLPDILAAVASKPMFISQEVRGNLPLARRFLAPARRAYRALGGKDKLRLYYDRGQRHRFVGEPLYQWIERLWPIRREQARGKPRR